MKSLATLIKLQQRELDQLRKQQSLLEEARDNVIGRIESLHDELIRELQAAGDMAEMRGFFGDFSDAIKKKQKALATKVVQLEQQIQELGILIAERFSELKKYEIARDNRLARQKEERERKEQRDMDELGLAVFRRKDTV